jgi:mannan endo-1,4-beta-mannosidase
MDHGMSAPQPVEPAEDLGSSPVGDSADPVPDPRMAPSSRRPAVRWASDWRSARIKAYALSAIAAAVVIGTAAAVTLALQAKPAYPIHPTPAVRYLGLHEPDAPGSYTGVDQFAQAIGRQPNLVSYYSPWGDPFQAGFAAMAAQHGAITLIQMDPKDVSLASIAAGRYDAYLRSYAAALSAFGGQVILSFGHEMNGNWYTWGYQHTPARVFVHAWRHIVDVFRTRGTRNVTWLWTVNIMNKEPPIPSPAPWWPGSAYVNWVGIDGYYYLPSASFAQVFGPTVVAIRALTADPILIAETGAEVSAGQPAKIHDLFDGVRAYGLFGFVWFDENVEGRAWRVSSPQAFAAFRRDASAFLRPPATPGSAQSPRFGSPSP